MVRNNTYSIKGILKGVGFFAIYAAMMMTFQALLSVVFMTAKALQGVRDEAILTVFATDNLLGSVLISNIFIGTAFFLICKTGGKSIAKVWKLNPFTWKAAATASVCTFAYTILFILAKNHLGISEPDVTTASADYYSSIFRGFGVIMLSLNILVAAPIVEEIVLRGVVFNQIESTTDSRTAIIGSALLFGLMHIMAGGAALVAGAFLIGLILGVIYARTKNLWVCIIAHAAANLPEVYFYLIQ